MVHELPLSILLLIIVITFYIIDFSFLLRYDRQRAQGKGWAWDYTLFTLTASLIIVIQPWLLLQLGLSLPRTIAFIAQSLGLLSVVGSFALHIWARRHLQRFYAERVEVQRDHQVIQSGPYAHVRHPVITSFFLLAAGLLLLSPALTTALGLVYAIWDFTRAAKQEEQLLSKNLAGYTDYAQRVPRFFPSILKGTK